MTDKPVDSQPALDLSVVTYNSAKWIEGFFVSLLKQDFPLSRINLIIRDNHSTDETLEVCRQAVDRHAGGFMSVQISAGENIGFGAGHNRNLAQGNSPYFLVSNIDLEFATDSISQAMRAAENDDATTASWEFRQKPYEHPKYYHPVSLETSWSSSACVLFRRATMESVGGYEERIFMYGEDVELSYRLRDHGFKLKYCPKAVCWHYSYEQANQLKPLQFFGSTLANLYIRMRYGSALEILYGFAMHVGLWFFAPALPGKWDGLFRNGYQLLFNAPYFLLSRKNSRERFAFHGWDYELRREGAFYPYRQAVHKEFPLVSVVMRTYKGRLHWLREAVASVVNQSYPNIELVVVEDGSEEAHDFIHQVMQEACLASVVYRPISKQGRCHAGNSGLAAANGKFLAFLDDDDLYFADHLEVMVDELSDNPDLVGAYGLAFETPTKVKSLSPLVYEEQRREVILRQKFSRAILWHHNYIPIQAMVFRRELYDERGGFDVSLDNLEDWNLWTRYSLQRDFMLVEKVTSLYRVPDDTEQLMRRQKNLDGYYAQAVLKQNDMRVSLTPAEVVAYSQELSRNINAVVIPYLRIRNFLIRNKLLNVFYYMAVRVVNKLRAKRRH